MVSLESHFAQPIQPPELPPSEKAAKAATPVRPNEAEAPEPTVAVNEADFAEPLPEQGAPRRYLCRRFAPNPNGQYAPAKILRHDPGPGRGQSL